MFQDDRTVSPSTVIRVKVCIEKLSPQTKVDKKAKTIDDEVERLKKIHEVDSRFRRIFDRSVDDEHVGVAHPQLL